MRERSSELGCVFKMLVIARRQTKPERLDGEINEQGSVISRCEARRASRKGRGVREGWNVGSALARGRMWLGLNTEGAENTE